jgi:hypothetical protein
LEEDATSKENTNLFTGEKIFCDDENTWYYKVKINKG